MTGRFRVTMTLTSNKISSHIFGIIELWSQYQEDIEINQQDYERSNHRNFRNLQKLHLIKELDLLREYSLSERHSFGEWNIEGMFTFTKTSPFILIL